MCNNIRLKVKAKKFMSNSPLSLAYLPPRPWIPQVSEIKSCLLLFTRVNDLLRTEGEKKKRRLPPFPTLSGHLVPSHSSYSLTILSFSCLASHLSFTTTLVIRWSLKGSCLFFFCSSRCLFSLSSHSFPLSFLGIHSSLSLPSFVILFHYFLSITCFLSFAFILSILYILFPFFPFNISILSSLPFPSLIINGFHLSNRSVDLQYILR